MKAMIRLLIILLAAVTVVGATWAIGQASSSDSTTTVVQGERPETGDSGEFTPPVGGESHEGGDAHAAQWMSLQGWLGFAESLIPMVMIITLVTLPMSLWKRYQRVHKHASATAAQSA